MNRCNQRTQQVFTAGETLGYGYDSVGQLQLANSSVAGEDLSYAYDAAWNLNTQVTEVATNTFAVDNKNQLTNAPDGSALYDDNGNLTNRASGYFVYEYDDENRLTRIVVNGGEKETELAYDAFGRLRGRLEYEGGLLTNAVLYVYDGMRVIQERDGFNTPLVSYTRGKDLSPLLGGDGGGLEGAGGIGGLLARTDANGSACYHADGNGNITALVDGSQSLVAIYKYDPFGNTISASGALADANVYRFSSKEFHSGSGLYYYGFRWYVPELQRWLNRDPIGEYGGLNLYGYVGNNPIMFIDPYGLSFWGDFGNGLNNTVSGIGQSMGQGLYDLSHLTWSQNEYNRIANMMYSMDTPENPAATPYVMGALGVSAAAATTAAVALGGEVAASRGCFKLSEHVLKDSIGTEGRYWSETAVRNAINNGPRLANVGGETPIWNALTTFKYPVGNGGQVVLNWWTRTIVQYVPKW